MKKSGMTRKNKMEIRMKDSLIHTYIHPSKNRLGWFVDVWIHSDSGQSEG